MKSFLDDNFLLENDAGIELFNKYAKDMPIYDYHSHLDAKEIWEDKHFSNITELFLGSDHYKWRLMRANGIKESLITGNESDYNKFLAFAKTLSYAIGNPLYHWTHLELRRYFGTTDILNEKSAPDIWNKVNAHISSDDFSVRNLLRRSNVKLVCTTDDPIDNLEYHIKIQQEGKLSTKVLPTFRPDKAVGINKPGFSEYIKKLGEVCNKEIVYYTDLIECLLSRIEYFHQHGCRIADNDMNYVPCKKTTLAAIDAIFHKGLKGGKISALEEDQYKAYTLYTCAYEYANRGWTMQLHVGAMRNTNSRMLNEVGGDTGFDSINDLNIAQPLASFLDTLDSTNSLPKTIIYVLNPKDNYTLGAMTGNFQHEGMLGKIQFGSGWWYNDQKDGIYQQLRAYANLGILGNFVGMLTDSRSFISFTRHEYFRRILCNLLGEWVEKGEYPYDLEMLKEIIEGICFNNAQRYFGIEL